MICTCCISDSDVHQQALRELRQEEHRARVDEAKEMILENERRSTYLRRLFPWRVTITKEVFHD